MPYITCPNGHRLQIADRHLGQTIQCPSCQATFTAQAERENLDFSDRSQERDNREEDSEPRSRNRARRGAASLAGLVNTFAGKPLLFAGLLLVILGRGCDATGLRAVSRADAYYRQAKVSFQLDWDSKLAPVQQKIDKMNREMSEMRFGGKEKGDFKRMEEMRTEKEALDKELNKLRRDQSAAQSENENGVWKPLRETALKASNNHRMSIYWYEWLFIFGTVVLVVGLLTVAFTSEGGERWVAYIMIAIITFSIYVGGAAWIESIVSSASSAIPPAIERPSEGPGRVPR